MRLWRPWVAAVLVALWLGPALLGAPAEAPGVTPVDVLAFRVQPMLVLGCVVLAAVAGATRWRGLGLGPPRPGTLRLLWLPGLYILLFAVAVAAAGPPSGLALGVLVANTLLVGLVEEGLFRGFLYSGLRDALRPWPAILLVSALFGLAHLGNVLWTGDLQGALIQSVATAGLGVLLLALRIRTGSIWPPVLLHTAWNLGLLLLALAAPAGPAPEVTGPAAGATLLAFLPLLLYGIFLLRRVGRDGDGLGPPRAAVAPWQPSRVPRVGGARRQGASQTGDRAVIDASSIKEHAEVVGADGVHLGTVDKVEGDRIKLTKKDSGMGHMDHHHFLPLSLVAEVEAGDVVRLSATAAVAAEMFEEEEDRSSLN